MGGGLCPTVDSLKRLFTNFKRHITINHVYVQDVQVNMGIERLLDYRL